ncbi:MAG: hypothetical protein CMQ14_02655 [Gammaproteobacteria bacterium]|nr:hypothetical protein [Gammaproteobacteria bacterium]
MKIALSAALSILLCLLFQSGFAQSEQLQEIQRDLALFTGILEEELGLNESAGLFGRSLGGISSTYLMSQGVVFEVRSPLANRRNRMGLASLSTAMQALQLQENPFLAMRRSQPVAAAQTTALAADITNQDSRYLQLQDQIANIDYSLVMNTAIQQATHSVRALRALGSVDEDGYEALFGKVEALRGQIETNVAELRSLEAELRVHQVEPDSAAESADASGIQQRVNDLLQRLELIKAEALALASDLRQRSAQAEAEFALQWQQDLLTFERALYGTLCEYGETLIHIPGRESLSFILQGLGDDREDSRRTDKVHIVKQEDVSACVVQAFDSESLRARSTIYSY